jgi:ABC-type Fe3+ transport system permease subunit
VLLCCAAGVLTLPAIVAQCVWASDASAETEWQFHSVLTVLTSSLAWAVSIAICAVILAAPLAWTLRKVGVFAQVPLAIPLVLPSYLMSFCLTLLVQPQSKLGAWLATQGQANLPWLPGVVMQAIAFIGLVLWLCPLATLVLLPAARSLPATMLESLSLDASPFRKLLVIARHLRSSILACVLLLSVLMLGSAVPLHIANAPTLAVKAWASAVLSPASFAPWIASLPLLVIASVSAMLMIRAACAASERMHLKNEADDASQRTRDSRASKRRKLFAVFVPSVLVALPVLAAVFELRSTRSIASFLHVASSAIASSAVVGACAGVLLAMLAAVAWKRGPLHTQHACTKIACAVLLAWALVPGILVGQAYAMLLAQLVNLLPNASDVLGLALLVLAHVSRFAGVFVLLGFMFASLEPSQRRWARELDGAVSLPGWIRACVIGARGRVVPVLGALAAAGMSLSVHEIECAIMLQPPGTGSLGQTMLANLHFARSEELCAGVLATTLLALAPLIVLAGGAALATHLKHSSNAMTKEKAEHHQ